MSGLDAKGPSSIENEISVFLDLASTCVFSETRRLKPDSGEPNTCRCEKKNCRNIFSLTRCLGQQFALRILTSCFCLQFQRLNLGIVFKLFLVYFSILVKKFKDKKPIKAKESLKGRPGLLPGEDSRASAFCSLPTRRLRQTGLSLLDPRMN